MPPSIDGLTHISLSVGDLDRSLAFYRDVLGLSVIAGPFDGVRFDGRAALVLAGAIAIGLQEHRDREDSAFTPIRRGLDHLALSVPTMDELEQFVQRLDGLGIGHSEVRALPNAGHLIELRDPDGIQVELHCATSG